MTKEQKKYIFFQNECTYSALRGVFVKQSNSFAKNYTFFTDKKSMHLFKFHFRFQFSIFLKMNVILLKTPKILIGFIRFEESPVAFKVFFYVVVVIFSRMSIVLESYSLIYCVGVRLGEGGGGV